MPTTEEQRARRNARQREWYSALTEEERQARRETDRKKYAANREQVLQRKKAHRDANPDHYTARWKRYYEENRELLRERKRGRSKEERGRDNAKARKRYNSNPEKYRQRSAAYRQANRDRVRSASREANLRAVGFTTSLKNEAMVRQGYRCAGCSIDLRKITEKHVHADHCHKTLLPRGVLCRNCNVTLGLVKDRKETLLNLVEYLETPTLCQA